MKNQMTWLLVLLLAITSPAFSEDWTRVGQSTDCKQEGKWTVCKTRVNNEIETTKKSLPDLTEKGIRFWEITENAAGLGVSTRKYYDLNCNDKTFELLVFDIFGQGTDDPSIQKTVNEQLSKKQYIMPDDGLEVLCSLLYKAHTSNP